MSSKNVVFDVVGTLVCYDRLFDAIDHRLGDRLRTHGVKPSLLGNTWIETAEREYTYLSLARRYRPFVECMERLFYRILWMADIPEPRNFATAEDVKYMVSAYKCLDMRPGAVECITKLRQAGFTVWALTAADVAAVSGMFAQAGVDLPPENLLSCDKSGIGKPDLLAYKPLLEKLSDRGKPWFAAAHAWDLAGARQAGFRVAYSPVLEKEAVPELFGEMDAVGESLPEMADRIIASGCV